MSAMLHDCLADTDHQVVTAASGHRYGVWVTVPPGYADSPDSFPLVYVVDGNWTVGLTSPLVVCQSDPYLSIAPYVQVSIGYAGDEAAQWATLRNRDLVPPGEPVADEMVAILTAARDSGAMTQEHMDAYLAELADTHADVFLDFLTEELHPLLASQYRVSETGHGLFGYSYGGLFALYAWLRGGTPFSTVGAGSPGVVGLDSTVFALADGTAARSGSLHVTVNEPELLGTIPLYRGAALNSLTLVERLLSQGAPVTTAMLHDTHVTGLQASFLSYLKTSRAR